MRILAGIFFLSLGFVGRAAAVDEQVETHRFAFTSGGAVRVNTFTGGVRVMPTEEAEVRVVVAKIPSEAEPDAARRWLEQVEVAVAQEGATVSVDTRYRGSPVQFTFANHPRGGVRIELYVPRGCRLEVATRDGGVDIGPEWEGDVRVRVESGHIALGRIRGSVDAWIDAGDIQLSRATGDVLLRSRRGGLSVGTVFGRATLRADSGDIEILDACGGLEATAVAGDLKAGFPRVLAGASRLSADGGNIAVSLDPAASVTIDAKASIWGQVQTRRLPLDLEVEEKSRRRFVASLNNGGPRLQLRASGGDVMIQGMPGQLSAR